MIKQIIILVGSIFLAALAVGSYAFLYQEVSVSVADIADLGGDVASAGKRAALARSMQTLITDTAPERAELATFVAADQDIVGVIEAIEAEARRDKVSAVISSVSQGAGNGWKHHELITVKLTADGTFKALGAFTAALEGLPFASRLADVSYEVLSDGSWYGTFTVLVVARNASP